MINQFTAKEIQNARANTLYNDTYMSRSHGCNNKLRALNVCLEMTGAFEWEECGYVVNAAIDAAMWNCGHADMNGGISLGKISEADKNVRGLLRLHADALAAYERFIGCFPTGEQTVSYWAD